jgi:hypothetical protein
MLTSQPYTLFAYIGGGNKSLLDTDDLNGPGILEFPRLSGDLAMDYALFKITKYSESESPYEHKQFARGLAETAQQLGPRAAEYLTPLLQSLVRGT